MIALPSKLGSSGGTRIAIENVSSDPFNPTAALSRLSEKRIIQLDPPVTTLNAEAWNSILQAFFDKICDLIAGIYYGRFGMVEHLLSSDPREESEESEEKCKTRELDFSR